MRQLAQVAERGNRVSNGRAGITRTRRIAEGVEIDAIVWNVETGVIENVERIHIVTQCEPLRDSEILERAQVPAILEWPAENIALTFRVTVLKCIADLRPGT